jgi:hypothetical protein
MGIQTQQSNAAGLVNLEICYLWEKIINYSQSNEYYATENCYSLIRIKDPLDFDSSSKREVELPR